MIQPPLAVNARFLSQPLTGVQRFAIEITRALSDIATVALLAPCNAVEPGWAKLHQFGKHAGHAWEQIDLPRHARGRVLINLGNTAPLALRRQVVVLHDAAVWDIPAAYSWRFRTWYRLMQRGLVRRGATIATVSAFSRGRLAHHLGCDPAAIAVLGEGAEHILAAPSASGALGRLGITRPYVLAVGSLAPHKNLASLSATATMLAARNMDLVLTGAADDRIFAAGLLPRPARAVGRVDDATLRALYEGASCFAVPSHHEGFGLPALEAMACGCPVVAARAAALPEVCGDAALFADPQDPAEIAAAIARVLDMPEAAATLRAAGRARAAGFTWGRAASRLQVLAASLSQPCRYGPNNA